MKNKKENKKKKEEKEGLSEIKTSRIEKREIVDEMRSSYIDYAMSVIVARALPDVRDGLKPVHRKILFAMNELGLRNSAKFRKCAAVVGEVMAKYHPHGDMAIYDTLVRMAQDFNMRYPLISPQGNFGNIDGDKSAASRYTESKLSKFGEEMLSGIEKETVDFVDNYDSTKKEPVVLPSPLPQLILNGSMGIAVGMATNIPPHNLREVSDALIYLTDNPNAKTEDLCKFIKGPDFPTGGIIFGKKDIITAYSQGKGPIVVRGKAEIKEDKSGKTQIIINEIPYQTQKASLVEQFARLVKEKKLIGIKDIRDESDKEGMRIVFDLQRDGFPQKILNKLYKFTDLQKTFHLNMLALTDRVQPKVLSLLEVLREFIVHRKEVVVRRTKYELKKAKERYHILEGLHKCLSKIDDVIKTIKNSKDREDALNNLIKKFKLSDIQANAILDTKLSSLAKLERKKIEEELKEIEKKIKELMSILKSDKKVEDIFKKEVLDIKEKFGDERKTKVSAGGVEEIAEEDLIPHEETIITLTRGGYIKRINPNTYKIQKRGGRGILGMKTMQDDIIEHFLLADTHDSLLFFTDSGKVFRNTVYEIPEGTRVARGRGLLNFIDISPQDKILSIMTISKDEMKNGIKNLLMVTQNGIIKKTEIEHFKNVRKTGLIAIKLKKGDSLKKVSKSTGEGEVILTTKKGLAIRFKENEIRELGRTASGVKAMRLKKEDKVVGGCAIDFKKDKNKEEYLLILTENGFGKKTNVEEYRLQKRGGSGIKAANINLKTGDLVFANVLYGNEEDLIVISRKGHIIRTSVSSVPKLGRAAQGVKIMKLEPGNSAASAICV